MAELKKNIEFNAPISEITSDAAQRVLIPEDTFNELTDGDSDPQFVVVRIQGGISKNGIEYGKEILDSIAEQIRKHLPVGYLGHEHREPSKRDSLLPDPQTVWCGATSTVEDGKPVMYAKGYNLPDAKVRKWIVKKAVNSVSWTGDAILEPIRGGGYKAKEITMETLDWSRKLASGLPTSVVAVVAEMEGGTEVTAEEIAKLQLAELESHNPDLVRVIENRASTKTKDETVAEMDRKKDEALAEKDKEIAELPAVKEAKSFRERFDIPEDKSILDWAVDYFDSTQKNAREAIVEWFQNEVLPEKVPNEQARKLVGRLISVQEMEGKDWVKDNEKIRKDLNDKIDDALENDEAVKTVVAEMGSSRGGLNLTHTHTKNSDSKFSSDNLEEEFVSPV
jgi:hypothetical protein